MAFGGACGAPVLGVLVAVIGFGPACSSHGAASVDGGARGSGGLGGFGPEAGSDEVGSGDPDHSPDAAAGAGGGQAGSGGTAGSTIGGGPGTGGISDAGGASGTGDGGLPAPTEIHPCRLMGIGHTLSMDLSPDGKLAAYGSAEGGITLIGIADFVARRTITAHRENVTAVAFSPHTAKIASPDADGNVALWNVSNGSLIWSATGLDGRVQALVMSSGSLWALTAGGLSAIDAATGKYGAADTTGLGSAALAVSPDGSTIALGDTDGDVRLLHASGLSPAATIAAAHAGGVTALRISGDGRRLVTGGADGTTALWDLQGSLVARVAQPKQPASSVDVNYDGTLLAAAGVAPETVMAFKPDGTWVAGYGVFPSYTRLSFDGKYLVSMSGISRADRNSLDTTKSDGMAWEDFYTAAAFSPDGRYVAEAVYDNIRMWDTTTGEMARLLDTTPPITSPATGIAFSPDGATLARNDFNHNLYVFRTADSALLAQYTGVAGSNSVVYSPDGQWLATPGTAYVLLWRTSDGTTGPTGFVGSGGSAPTAVAFSPDGRALAVGDNSGSVIIRSFPDGAALAQFAAVPRTVQRIAFSPDGSRLAVSDQDDPPRLFALDGSALPLWPEALTSSFAFSFDGAYLATVLRGPPPTFPITVRNEVNDVLLSAPSTGTPVASSLWTTGIGFNQADDSLSARLVFAPRDRRLLIATGLGTLICLP